MTNVTNHATFKALRQLQDIQSKAASMTEEEKQQHELQFRQEQDQRIADAGINLLDICKRMPTSLIVYLQELTEEVDTMLDAAVDQWVEAGEPDDIQSFVLSRLTDWERKRLDLYCAAANIPIDMLFIDEEIDHD